MFPAVWRGFDGIYGGYVLAQVVEAVQVIDGFAPMSVSIQFTGAVRDVESDWKVEVLHHGGSTGAVSVALIQGHPRLTAFGKLAAGSPRRILDFPLDLSNIPGPEAVEPYHFSLADMPYEVFLDHRLIDDPRDVQQRETRAWIRFDESVRQAPELGRYGLAAIFLDAQPPGLFHGERTPVYVPTVEFTIHFAPDTAFDRHGWHFVTQRTMWATEDFCVEESYLYNGEGIFLAQVRQTRRIVWS